MPGEGPLIDREALDRIIQRAAELQTGEREIGDGLTKDEVVKLGADVGIPARYLQQALLEEQTRSVVAEGRGTMAWLLGPPLLVAERVVPGDKASVERALLRWMEEEELLQIKRRFPDRIAWEPRAGAFASIQRALGTMGRPYALARATQVVGQVTQLEPGFCHVQLQADVRNLRHRRIYGGMAMAGTGALLTGAMMVIGAFGVFALAPAVVMVPIAASFARAHAGENERIHTGLEQVLDRLERSEIQAEHRLPSSTTGPGSAFGRIVDEFRKTFQG